MLLAIIALSKAHYLQQWERKSTACNVKLEPQAA
jgi:hypothetical protein